MRNRFDRQLEQLNNELIEMGNLVEHAIQSAVTALSHSARTGSVAGSASG